MRPDASKLEEQYRCIIAYELAYNGKYKSARDVLMAKGIHGLSPLSLDILSRILIQTKSFQEANACLQIASSKSLNRQKYDILAKELENYSHEMHFRKILLVAKSSFIFLMIIMCGIFFNSRFFKIKNKQYQGIEKEIIPFEKTYHVDSRINNK